MSVPGPMSACVSVHVSVGECVWMNGVCLDGWVGGWVGGGWECG